MPRIPTRSTRTVSPSGRTGEVPLPVSIARTGGAVEARGYGALGAGISSIGQSLGQINLRFLAEENANELSRIDRSATEFMDRRLTDIAQMTDTTEMRQYWDETVQAMEENFKGTNDAVNNDLYRRLNSKITQGSVQVNNMWRNQIVRNTNTETQNMMDQAIQKNLPDQYEEALQRRERVGLDTPAEQEQLRQAFPVNVYLSEKMKEMEQYPENVALELGNVGDTITVNGETVELTMEQKDAVIALEERAKRKQRTNEIELNRQRQQAAMEFEDNATISMLGGEFEMDGEDIKGQILENPNLSPAQRRTLSNLYDETARSFSQEKPYTDIEKFKAYVEIRTAPSEEKMMLLAKHAAGLGFTQVKMLYDKMQNPASEDNFVVDSMESSLGAIESFRIAGIKERERTGEISSKDAEDQIIELNNNLTRRKMAVLSKIDADPNMTDEQKLQILDKELKPVREGVAQDMVNNPGWFRRTFGGGPFRAPLGHPGEIRIEVIGPNGEEGSVRADELEDAVAHGWRER